MPEKVFRKINERILPQWKICFLVSLAVGFLAHLYKITNWLPNWDSLVFRYDPQNMIGLGRWFLPVVCSFSSFYDLPFLNGIIAIIFHALGAVYICRILNAQKNITAGLIGALIVSFPTVTSVMMYSYVADGYAIAFFLSTLAAFYMTKENPKYILSAIFICLSTGIYQAYITVTIMLILLKLIDETIYYKATLRDILKKVGCMLLTGLAGVILYSIILKVILAVCSSELLDYQGMNETMSLSKIDIRDSLYTIKETFVNLFFDISKGISLYFLTNVFVLIFTLFYYAKYIVLNKLYKKPVNIFMVVVLSIMLVFGAGALTFINAWIDYHNLMLMGYSVFYLFFLILYERGSDTSKKPAVIKCWTVLAVGIVLIANQIVIANVSYHKAQIAYEKSYGVLIRIADRIEKTPKAENCEKIMVIGALSESEAYSVNLPPDITGVTDGFIIRADDETVGQSVFTSTINDYCGKNYKFVSGKEKQKLLKDEKIKSMNKWPNENCVKVIDDTLIIKLG